MSIKLGYSVLPFRVNQGKRYLLSETGDRKIPAEGHDNLELEG